MIRLTYLTGEQIMAKDASHALQHWFVLQSLRISLPLDSIPLTVFVDHRKFVNTGDPSFLDHVISAIERKYGTAPEVPGEYEFDAKCRLVLDWLHKNGKNGNFLMTDIL